jgi:uncharacterized linocin/CFP29 family protein
VNTGHLTERGCARGRRDRPPAAAQPLVRLRVPFTVDRDDVDDVERGAQDADWQPVKDAAKKIAFAEDRPCSRATSGRHHRDQAEHVQPGAHPAREVRDYPNASARRSSALRLAGVGGPFSLLLSPTPTRW